MKYNFERGFPTSGTSGFISAFYICTRKGRKCALMKNWGNNSKT